MADEKKVVIDLQLCPFAVDVKYHPGPSPVANAMAKNKEEAMLPPVVPTVCVWVLINAFVAAALSILNMILNRIPCSKSVLFFRCVAVTPAVAAEASSTLVQGQLWCSFPQATAAVAAALALLLPLLTGKRCRRIRWVLAVVALAATAANHYMKLRRMNSLRAAAPGDVFVIAEVVFGFLNLTFDLLCFLGLLLADDGDSEE
ncbi:unnamed protein product [Urochloa humidicola]